MKKIVLMLFGIFALIASLLLIIYLGLFLPINKPNSYVRVCNTEAVKDWVNKSDNLSEQVENYISVDSINNISENNTSYSIITLTCLEDDNILEGGYVLVKTETGFSDTILEDYFAKVLEIGDVNQDGFSEAIIELGSGGNCLVCTKTEIIQFKNGLVVNLTEEMNDPLQGFVVNSLEDLDEDGVKELIIIDIRQNIFGIKPPDSDTLYTKYPFQYRIYQWDGAEYTDRTSKFSSYVPNI